MFEGIRNMAGMASLMRDLPRMQQRMEEVKAALRTMRVEAVSEGGAVRVVATGDLDIAELTIADPARQDLDTLVRDTVNTALSMARDEMQRRLAEAAEEMGLPVPPGGMQLPGSM
ncbi:MAG: YbaB/EbfC family nucleoid-associated protein [Phycisphaerales bacterium]|jgi:hypothetical protein|nr:YbaB/EbfC family nucleoid-associated protein [Phycisphaerales bacterium]